MKDFNTECEEIISSVQNLLRHNPEWICRYSNYAQSIHKNLETIKNNKAKFHEWAPLYYYMTVSQAKGQMLLSLRYQGQDVANLKTNGDGNTISTKDFSIKNKRDFGCDVELDNVEWRSQEAKNFRHHFSNLPPRTNDSAKNNHEHRIESLLLTEFSKKVSEEKLLLNIQPVKIAGHARFQMPTPLGASNMKDLKYSGASGGGIDIISRIGKSTKLCIMEVKDENNSKEPPVAAIKQGLAYASFVRELLRSESGEAWWKLYGFTGKIPESLEIYVASVMPLVSSDDTSFAGTTLKIGNDSFHLHYLYFQEQDNKLTAITSSLPQCQVKQ